LYLAQNNLLFVAVANLEAVVYQVIFLFFEKFIKKNSCSCFFSSFVVPILLCIGFFCGKSQRLNKTKNEVV